jgi:hypothetical protein
MWSPYFQLKMLFCSGGRHAASKECCPIQVVAMLPVDKAVLFSGI